MGAWGVALFSDDLASDVRDGFRDLIGDGLSVSAAVAKLLEEYASELDEDDEIPVFWLALAAAQWKLGRLEERTKREAFQVIESGSDLERWDDPKDRTKRQAVLEKLRLQLVSPPPPAKRVPRTVRSASDWAVGEVVALQLASGDWTLLRTIGHHADKGGRSAVCELLDWRGNSIPNAEIVENLPVRHGNERHGVSQFLFQEPRKKQDQARVRRLGLVSTPAQECGGYAIFVWPYIDRLMKDCYDLG